MLKVAVRQVADVAIIELHGRLLQGEEDPLVTAATRLVDSGCRKLLLDFSDCPEIDIKYGGFGEVVRLYTRLRSLQGSLKLLRLAKRVRELLEITKLLTVLEAFDSEADALASFEDPTRATYVAAIAPTADGALHLQIFRTGEIAEVSEVADSRRAPHALFLPCTGLLAAAEIDEFETLLNADPPAAESAYQTFLERHPRWLSVLGEQYETATPQFRLPRFDTNPMLALSDARIEDVTLVPDFLLKRIGLNLWDVLDLKSSEMRILAGPPTRRHFSSAVVMAVAQLREYSVRLRDPRTRHFLTTRFDMHISTPLPMVVVGRDLSFHDDVEKDRFRMLEGVRVYTYDDLHRLARARALRH